MFTYYSNPDNDGCLVLKGATTLKRYEEIREKTRKFRHPGMTYAFGEKQMKEALDRLRPQLKEGEKIIYDRYGMLATPTALEAWKSALKEEREAIARECDPSEVYAYEYNNHECFYSFEGDEIPYGIVRDYFGEERASKVKRIRY